jgi:hypothetical protein
MEVLPSVGSDLSEFSIYFKCTATLLESVAYFYSKQETISVLYGLATLSICIQ